MFPRVFAMSCAGSNVPRLSAARLHAARNVLLQTLVRGFGCEWNVPASFAAIVAPSPSRWWSRAGVLINHEVFDPFRRIAASSRRSSRSQKMVNPSRFAPPQAQGRSETVLPFSSLDEFEKPILI